MNCRCAESRPDFVAAGADSSTGFARASCQLPDPADPDACPDPESLVDDVLALDAELSWDAPFILKQRATVPQLCKALAYATCLAAVPLPTGTIDPLTYKALIRSAAHAYAVGNDHGLASDVGARAVAARPADLAFREQWIRGLLTAGRHEQLLTEADRMRAAAMAAGNNRLVVAADEFAGRALMALGRFAEAEQRLKRGATVLDELLTNASAAGAAKRASTYKYPGCPYQALGELYGHLGRLDEQASSVARAAEIEPSKGDSQYDAALAALAAGDSKQALSFAARARALGEVAPAEAVEQAVARLQGSEAPGAWPLEAARIARKHRGIDLLAPWHYALRAMEAGAPDAAALVHELMPGDPLSLAVKSLLTDRFGEARLIAEAEPPSKRAPSLAIVIAFAKLFERDYDGARAQRAVVAGSPSLAAAVGIIDGHLALIERRHADAERHFTDALAAAPGDPAIAPVLSRFARLGLGWSFANRNEQDKALAAFDALLASAPDDLLALVARGNALSSLGRADEARANYKRVLSLSPGHAFAHAELGRLELNDDRLDQAEAHFRKALEGGIDKYTCPHEGLGLVYLRQGRVGEAQRHLERAIEINPDVEYKKFNALARIKLEAGDREGARALLEKSRANYPYDEEAANLLRGLDAAADSR